MTLLLLALLAPATPASAPSDVGWLPLEGPWASVRLAAGVSITDPAVAPHLARGWRVGSDHRGLIEAVRAVAPQAPDPGRTWRLPTADALALHRAGHAEDVWGHPEPGPPPGHPADRLPITPDLAPEQAWDTLGMDDRAWWPGGTGRDVAIASVEYAFDPLHEDLAVAAPTVLQGVPVATWAYHGNAVLSLLGAADEGFGTTGAAPEATLLVVHPLAADDTYDVADAILAATDALAPGDVIVVEQTADTALGPAPPSADPAVFDAIALATAAGLVVVEPAANGATDLDDPAWEGWWARDHGGVVVGAVDPADGAWDGTSGFGARVDVHAHGRDVLAATDDTFRPDRFFPRGDPRQAYTTGFGGTSAAAAQVAGALAVAQGVHRRLHGEPASPRALRSWLIASGRPQDPGPPTDPDLGAAVDLERLIRAWIVP